ncbi:hypothetical protein [Microbulbifer agarilyticus]
MKMQIPAGSVNDTKNVLLTRQANPRRNLSGSTRPATPAVANNSVRYPDEFERRFVLSNN